MNGSEGGSRGRIAESGEPWSVWAAPILAGLFAAGGCGRSEAGQSWHFDGSREASTVGLWLGPVPTVFYRAASAPGQQDPATVRLELDESARFTPDWRHVVRCRFDGGKTQVRFDEGPIRTIAGYFEPSLDPAGTALLAVREPDDEGQSQLELFDRDGEMLADLTAEGLMWVALSGGGERIALGTSEGVRVLRLDGHDFLSLFPSPLPAAEAGALSTDGAWLVLERQGELSLVSLQDARQGTPWTNPVTGRASSLAFAGQRILRVSREQLLAFDASTDPPAKLLDLAPPSDFLWRDLVQGPPGELVVGRIRVDRPSLLEPAQQGPVYKAGSARVGVDRIDLATAARRSVEWDVELWNHESPQLAFDAEGRLYAIVWPSAREVVLP